MARDFPQKTNGYVLHVGRYGEADKLVTLYTQDRGRITCIAKGAYKSKQRFVNKLEPYSHLCLFYQTPRTPSGLFFLQEAELLQSHLPLRQDSRRYLAASHFSELILKFTQEQDPEPALYQLLAWTLAQLSQASVPLKISAFSQVHLLSVLGYQPNLQTCGRCHQPVTPPSTYLLLPGNGTLLCSNCDAQASLTMRLSVQTIRTLDRVQSTSFERLPRLQLTPQGVLEALNGLHNYLLHLLQHDIHSWQLLHQLAHNQAIAASTGHCK
ncbi:DNA repair protein RecO [Desulfobulbus rhabdoformis]|jgi:DNA repair protein RecO (recombination protein O)|uniref:DNA repair protein RecO n=1 Tax=Desulfobulbus rhabdoformis TaxID=34032 RepID=UPI001F06A0F8|nr:DNA repair protein RecO [Desulfobulbus rhabdoformis]